MSITISFMHYMKWTRVMLPVVFEEFKVVYIIFCHFFLFTSIVNCKRFSKLFSKNLGVLQAPSPPGFYGPGLIKYNSFQDICIRVQSFKLCCLRSYSYKLHKNWSFPLKISSVNVAKSAGNCGFGHI